MPRQAYELSEADIPLEQIITAENGKPLADARGEVTYGGACLPFFVQLWLY